MAASVGGVTKFGEAAWELAKGIFKVDNKNAALRELNQRFGTTYKSFDEVPEDTVKNLRKEYGTKVAEEAKGTTKSSEDVLSKYADEVSPEEAGEIETVIPEVVQQKLLPASRRANVIDTTATIPESRRLAAPRSEREFGVGETIYAGPGQEGPVKFSPEGFEAGVNKSQAPKTLSDVINKRTTANNDLSGGTKVVDGVPTAVALGAGTAVVGGLGALGAGLSSNNEAGPSTPTPTPTRLIQGLTERKRANKIEESAFESMPGQSAPVGFTSTEEDIAQAKSDVELSKKKDTERLAEIDSGITALTGTLTASGANPNPTVVQQLETLQAEKRQVQSRLTNTAEPSTEPKSAAISTEVPAPTKGRGPIASGKEYGTLLDKLKSTTEEEPEKPSSLREVVAAAPMAPSPTEPTPSPYEQSMAELKGERATAKAERDADLRRAEIGELASIIGQSLTQIGAAASGMRSGVDMSGIAQKALVDWDKRKDQVMNLYKQNVAELDGQQAKLERAKERADDKVEKEAYQKAQMKLAREKMQQDKDIAAQNNQIKMLAAIATKNDKAIKDSETQYTRNLAKLDKREADLRKVEELNILNKTKEVIAGELASLLGEESVKEEGIFYGENILSKDDLMKLVADKKAEIRQERDQVYKNLETLTAYQVRANAPKAAAPAPAAQASAGQPPSADDMVRVELEGKELRMPRANLQAAKNKYPNLKVLE
jgi:hypothetical protein